MSRESYCVGCVSAGEGLLYNSSMQRKHSFSAILEALRQQIALLATRKGVLAKNDSIKLATEKHLRKLQGSLKGSGALQVLIDERQKEM